MSWPWPSNTRAFVATWLLATIVQLSLVAAPSVAAEREAHVLILNGADAYFPAYLAIDGAMRASLANQSGSI